MIKKILLVDDSATMLMMERMILAGGRYALSTASDGQEAVERARRDRPDLILMDVVMPRMGGLDACRTLRGDEATRTVPIILVTTRGDTSSMEAGFDSGCTDYVTKPVDSAELLAKIRNLIGE